MAIEQPDVKSALRAARERTGLLLSAITTDNRSFVIRIIVSGTAPADTGPMSATAAIEFLESIK